MSHFNELKKKLNEPVQRSDISFCITGFDKANRKVKVKEQIKPWPLMCHLDELFGIGRDIQKQIA